MALSLDGLVTGNNTTELINQLMAVEGNQQTLLKSKKSSASSLVTALQALNTKVASLAEFAKTAAKPDSWKAMAATSSASSVSVSASTSALASALTFTVDKLATAQSTLVTLPADASGYPSDPPAITIARGDTLTTVRPASGSLADVTTALNAAKEAGVSAVAVRVSAASEGVEAQYRLQVSATATGADKGFEIFLGDSDAVTALRADPSSTGAVRLTGTPAAQQITAASDAAITLFPGADAPVRLTSSTNSFADVLTGVSLTVSALEEKPVTVTARPDASAMQTLAKNVVTNLQTVLSEITSRTTATESTGSDGRPILTGGLFSGDSGIRMLQQQIQAAGTTPTDGVSPAEVGIIIGKNGGFTFDEAKFAAALAADPAKVQKVVQGVATALEKVATDASDKSTGSLSMKITGQESTIKALGDSITNWDYRLQLRRTSLERTYSNLEVTLGKMQSDQSWLTTQLAQLPKWGSS